jgi:hypothetical protein
MNCWRNCYCLWLSCVVLFYVRKAHKKYSRLLPLISVIVVGVSCAAKIRDSHTKVAPVLAMAVYMVSRSMSLLLLNLRNRWEWSISRSGCFITGYPSYRRLSGPQSRSGCFEEEINLLHLSGIESQIVQPSHNIDYSIPASQEQSIPCCFTTRYRHIT